MDIPTCAKEKKEGTALTVCFLWYVPSQLILLACIIFEELIPHGSWEIWEAGLLCLPPKRPWVSPLPALAP